MLMLMPFAVAEMCSNDAARLTLALLILALLILTLLMLALLGAALLPADEMLMALL